MKPAEIKEQELFKINSLCDREIRRLLINSRYLWTSLNTITALA
jgi:hypothetical protein